MRFQISFASGTPVYLQLVDQIKAAVASGALRTGEALPSIRPLAEELRVNRNTVAKAYAELENQGVITTLAGRGCFVKEAGTPLRKAARLERLAAVLDQAVTEAHHLMVTKADFLALAEERLDAFEAQRARAERAEKG